MESEIVFMRRLVWIGMVLSACLQCDRQEMIALADWAQDVGLDGTGTRDESPAEERDLAEEPAEAGDLVEELERKSVAPICSTSAPTVLWVLPLQRVVTGRWSIVRMNGDGFLAGGWFAGDNFALGDIKLDLKPPGLGVSDLLLAKVALDGKPEWVEVGGGPCGRNQVPGLE